MAALSLPDSWQARQTPMSVLLTPSRPEQQSFHTPHTLALMLAWRCLVCRAAPCIQELRQPCQLTPCVPCCATLCCAVQVSKRSTLYDDASSVTSDDSSRPGSFGPAAAAAAAAGGQRQSAYAAALARLQAAKRGAGRPCSSQGRGRGCDDDASSSSSTDAGDDDSCVMGV